jgi:muramoyltetrapeptide carboxypeptidase
MLGYLRERFDVPLLQGLPFGHMKDKLTLPVGARCAIDANADGFRLVFDRTV